MDGLTERERRVFDRIAAGITTEEWRHIPRADAVAAFRSDYHAFHRAYTLINLAALPFAVPILLSLFAFDLPIGLNIALLIPLLTLTVISYRRMAAFRQGMRFTLQGIANRNRRTMQNAAAMPRSG